MRQLRFIAIGLVTFLFVTSAVFLRKIITVFLCGTLSFNSPICYSFSNLDEAANATASQSSAVVPSKSNTNSADVVPKQKQKVAGCIFGVCVNLPSVPGVINTENLLEPAKSAVIKSIGESLGVGSPLLLDQNSAYPDVSDQVKDFRPKKLTISSAKDLEQPLPPGDYSVFVIAYCTQFSIHAPGQGLPYKLAPLQGKQAPAIGALLSRGTLQNIAPATLNANAWRIQAGLPLRQWSPQDQALIHKLIPEYEEGLQGDYLQQIEDTYNQFRLVPGIPSLDDLLRQTGAAGQLVQQFKQSRNLLSDQTIAAERLPEMLYQPTNDGLPRVLPAFKDSSPSRWSEIQPGVFARFTVIEGNLGKNLLEFRVTPKAVVASNNSDAFEITTKSLDKNLQVSNASDQAFVPILLGLASGIIAYSISSPAQALIVEPISEAMSDELPSLVITNPSTDWTKYPITETPTMPSINATAELRGIQSVNPQDIQYIWTLQIGGYEVNKDELQKEEGLDASIPIVEALKNAAWFPYIFTVKETKVGLNWNPDFSKSKPHIDGRIVGGWGKLTVEATVNNKTIKSEPRWVDISGANPSRELVDNYINSSEKLGQNDKNIYALIAYHESNCTLSQFQNSPNNSHHYKKPTPDGKEDKNPANDPLNNEPIDSRVTFNGQNPTPLGLRPRFGFPAGIGIAQLDPANFPSQHWNWKKNIDGGIETYKKKKEFAMGWNKKETLRLEEELQEIKKLISAHGYKINDKVKIPDIPKVPQLEGEMLKRNTIRLYNGGNEYYFDANYVAVESNLDPSVANIEIIGTKSWKDYVVDDDNKLVHISFFWKGKTGIIGKIAAKIKPETVRVLEQNDNSIENYVELVESGKCK